MSKTKQPYRVLLTDPAIDDLIHVAQWYSEHHPQGEGRFFESFARLSDMFAQHPRAGRERPDLLEGLRSWPAHPFVIFYTAVDAERLVIIERVIHGSMDLGEADFDWL